MTPSAPPILATFPTAKQQRLDELLDRNAEQNITPVELSELQSLVDEAESLMAANARMVAEFASRQSPTPPPGAVPVTVWVAPQHADH